MAVKKVLTNNDYISWRRRALVAERKLIGLPPVEKELEHVQLELKYMKETLDRVRSERDAVMGDVAVEMEKLRSDVRHWKERHALTLNEAAELRLKLQCALHDTTVLLRVLDNVSRVLVGSTG